MEAGKEGASNVVRQVRKRDGRLADFDEVHIANAISAAAKSVGEDDPAMVKNLARKVGEILEIFFKSGHIPSVEAIQDLVEKILIEEGKAKTAKAYILYRSQHEQLRKQQDLKDFITKLIGDYVDRSDWRVQENANAGYSCSGLMMHIAGSTIAHYVLNNIYPPDIGQSHIDGDIHIHDLSMGVVGYCAGWSLPKLIMEGFNGVANKIDSRPASHLDSALWQMINFIGTLQNEWAGAQAFSSVDTLLAPFIKADQLPYKRVKQNVQGFIFNMNVSSRWGGQTPFSNVTFDWMCPPDLKDKRAIVGGKEMPYTYGDCQPEMDMLNRAFIEVMTEGDMNGRTFTFPIPTYNITEDFNWDSETANLLFEMTAKYGIPYFQNFIKSDLNPSDVRSMCCRLQMDMRELRKKGGGLFGASDMTGSVGVVTINLARIGYLAKSEEEYFVRLGKLMEISKRALEIKRKVVQRNMDNGLMPYTKRYLGTLNNHFSTIGINGMNESLMNFFGSEITTGTQKGREFTIKVLDFMRERISDYQEETGVIYNLEATPAEGTSYRFARIDKKLFGANIAQQGKVDTYYTNSTQLPVGFTTDIFEALDLQEDIQRKYTGGTVLHGFMGERISDPQLCKQLVKRIAENYRIPYFTITPTFSVCSKKHGYIVGEHEYCPKCDEELLRQEQAMNLPPEQTKLVM